MELNVTHQLLDYADDVNLLCENIYAVPQKTEVL
jgi:hypothetical protein